MNEEAPGKLEEKEILVTWRMVILRSWLSKLLLAANSFAQIFFKGKLGRSGD